MIRHRIAAAALGIHVIVAAARADEPKIAPHPETQQALGELVLAGHRPEADQWRLLSRAIAIADRNHRQFVQQVVLFAHASSDQVQVPGVYRIMRWAGITDVEVAQAVAPLLYCSDAPLRKAARRLLPFKRSQERIGAVDLSDFHSIIVAAPEDEDVQFLRRAVFELAPESAFLLFHTEAKPTELIGLRRHARNIGNALFEKLWLNGIPREGLGPTASDSIAALASSEYWWARLFVAEVMVQHKEFRNEKLIELMQRDENELVRKSIQSLRDPDPLRLTNVDK